MSYDRGKKRMNARTTSGREVENDGQREKKNKRKENEERTWIYIHIHGEIEEKKNYTARNQSEEKEGRKVTDEY